MRIVLKWQWESFSSGNGNHSQASGRLSLERGRPVRRRCESHSQSHESHTIAQQSPVTWGDNRERSAGAVQAWRRGFVIPASERTLRVDPLPGFCLFAGAAGEPRGKTPVACGKRSGGMSAPPLILWHCRQYGISSRQSWSGPSLPWAAWSARRSCQSEASTVERSIAHRRSLKCRFSRRSCSRSCSRCSRWRPFVVHSPPVKAEPPPHLLRGRSAGKCGSSGDARGFQPELGLQQLRSEPVGSATSALARV
jgi:hypothetical protein